MFLRDDSYTDVRGRFRRNIIGCVENNRIYPFFIEEVGESNRYPFILRGSLYREGSWVPTNYKTNAKNLVHFPVGNGYINLLSTTYFPVVHVSLTAPHSVLRGVNSHNLIVHRAGRNNIDRNQATSLPPPVFSEGVLLEQILSPEYFSYEEALKVIKKKAGVAINKNVALRKVAGKVGGKSRGIGVLVRERLVGKLEGNVVVLSPYCDVFKQELAEAGVEIVQ